jgi:hypothetical protein
MKGKSRVFKAVTTAVFSLVFCGVMPGCSGGEDNPGVGGKEGGVGIVGDWRIVSVAYGGGKNEKQPDDYCVVWSFKSSGEFITTEAVDIGDFWIEWSESTQYYVTGSGYYLIKQYREPHGVLISDTTNVTYKINGNDLALTRCSRDKYDNSEYCDEFALAKVKLDDVRKSLGTVYTTDPAIKGHWVLREEGDDWYSEEYLSFDNSLDDRYFDGGYKYIKAENSDGYWCTNGNKLILVDDEDYALLVELEYSVSVSGKNKTLTINGDKWELDDDYL